MVLYGVACDDAVNQRGAGVLLTKVIRMKNIVILILFCALRPLSSQTKVEEGPTIPSLPDVNPQILKLVIEDQWDRGNDMFGQSKPTTPTGIDWKRVSERDEERHGEVHKLLSANQLKSARDYYFAALIFQHSTRADDLMFGHVLAMTAVSKGDASAKWMAAATLDRYLNALGQPQVFGTQFHCDQGKGWTLEPYNRQTLSDAERALWSVNSVADQERMLRDMQNGVSGGPTQVRTCK